MMRLLPLLGLGLVATTNARLTAEIFVDPESGDDGSLGAVESPLRTVHVARDSVRRLLASNPELDVTVQLLPGVHDVGTRPLALTAADSGRNGGIVTWRSQDPTLPAVVGAPVKVTGWKAHPTIDGAMSAPLPANITKGSALRQLWVDGKRAQRTRVYGHGWQQGDNRKGYCHNLTNSTPTDLYPAGSAYDFTYENSTDPASWANPGDVEFVYTSCDAINCWIEPRCTVESVEGKVVKLKQADNSSCFHRLYYYAQCFTNGEGPGRSLSCKGQQCRGRNPTSIENVGLNASGNAPGTFYYDRAAGTISYVPREGETAATLEATATTATQQELVTLTGAKNVRWEGVHFAYATWLDASGQKGYIDTQSGYQCQAVANSKDGEPPTNIAISNSLNISVVSCAFRHLGAVYALGADGASQEIIVSNCTFDDLSGGAVKLGKSGERGAPAPDPSTPVAKQDRGYLVADNLMTGNTREYSSANPIFVGYVADTFLVHNTIDDTKYSGICAGWGWGLASYTRNIQIENNSITNVMQLLSDGGGVYTNTPCPDCHVSRNYFANDPHVYGCLYHDGGSGLWTDENNVFNHVGTSAVFCHGTCPGISISPIYYNDSGAPNMQGATNSKLHNAAGVCVAPTIVQLAPGAQWTGVAADVVENAGRRTTPGALMAPAISPPVNKSQEQSQQPCVRFAARTCDASKASQRWHLLSGVKPGDGKPTTIKSAIVRNATCMQVENGAKISVNYDSNTNGAHGGCKSKLSGPDGCKMLPAPNGYNGTNACDYDQAFVFNANGTVALWNTLAMHNNKLVYNHQCMQINPKDNSVGMSPCASESDPEKPNVPSQKWEVNSNSDGTVTIKQGSLCVDNNYIVDVEPPALAHGGPWQPGA